MKSEVVYICALFKGETGIQLASQCEVLLFECSLPDQVAVVVPYFENVTITLKKSDIKYFLYDEGEALVKFKLTKPLADKTDVPRSETCEQLANWHLSFLRNHIRFQIKEMNFAFFVIFQRNISME